MQVKLCAILVIIGATLAGGCTTTRLETPEGYKVYRSSWGQRLSARILFDENGTPRLIEYGNDGGERAAKATVEGATAAVMDLLMQLGVIK